MQAAVTSVASSPSTSSPILPCPPRTSGDASSIQVEGQHPSSPPNSTPLDAIVTTIVRCTQETFRLFSSIFCPTPNNTLKTAPNPEILHGGIINPGNSCYLNATVQALLASSIEEHYSVNPTPIQNVARNHLHNFRQSIEKNETVPLSEVVKLRSFVFEHGFRHIEDPNTKEAITGQQDAQEFCLHLLELLGIEPFQYYEPVFYESAEAIPLLERQSPLTTSIITISPDRSRFFGTLDELLNGAIEEEEWPTEPNNTRNHIPILRCLQLDHPTAPEVLPIHIQRFEQTTTGLHKKEALIAPSETLKIRLHGTPDATCIYQLAAVVVRESDTTNSGHFYTYIPKYLDGSQVWIECNDAKVITHTDLERPMQVASESGYLYFYRRRDAILSSSEVSVCEEDSLKSFDTPSNPRELNGEAP